MPDPPVGDWIDAYAEWAEPSIRNHRWGRSIRACCAARAGYYGHMTHIDHQINRFMEVLHEYGQRENSYVCFTSDHGEMMGDHHLFRKSLPYEGSARIPMLLKGPARSGIKRGSRERCGGRAAGRACRLCWIAPACRCPRRWKDAACCASVVGTLRAEPATSPAELA